MESVADGVVDLYGEGEQRPAAFLAAFPHRKDRGEVSVPLLQVEVEPLEGGPGDHGDGKGVLRHVGLGGKSLLVAVFGKVFAIGGAKLFVVGAEFCLKHGKGLRVLVKDGIRGMHDVVDAEFTLFVERRPVFFVPVDGRGEAVEQGGMQPPAPFEYGRDVQSDGHAVRAGHFGKVMLEIFLSVPGFQVDGG